MTRKRGPWEKAGAEPRLAELLSDPIAQLLMTADGLIVEDVIAAIWGSARPRRRSRLDPVSKTDERPLCGGTSQRK